MWKATRSRTLFTKQQSLMHAEPMLLIDDGKAQLFELHLLLKQRVSTNGNLRSARSEICQCLRSSSACSFAGQHRDVQVQRREPMRKVTTVLFGEKLGRSHHC